MARIADLMLEIGRARASGIAGAGQAYGQSVASLGGILRDYRQGKLQDQELAANERFRTDQLTLARNRDTRDAAAETRTAADFAAQQDLAKKAQVKGLVVTMIGQTMNAPDEEIGPRYQAIKSFVGEHYPEFGATLPPSMTKHDLQREYVLLTNPTGLMEFDQPKPIAVGENGMVAPQADGSYKQVVPPPAPKAPNSQESSFLLNGQPVKGDYIPGANGQPGRYFRNGQDVTARASVIPPASVQYPKDESAVALSAEGLDAAAMMFGKTGQLPPMGMGKAAADARTRIINRAAVLIPGLDIASAKADFAANQDSEKAIQKQLDAVTSFEETATKNLGLFITAAGKIPDSGSPILNRPIRTLSDSLFGSPEMATFNAQRRTVIPEFAKILNNPNLSGQLSDSARHEIEEVMSGNATLTQMVATAKALVQDTTNRKTSMTQQLQAIRARIKKGSDAPATSQAPAAPAGWKYVPKAGGGWTAVEDK